MMVGMSTIHNPINFNPADYEIYGYWDNQMPEARWGQTYEDRQRELEFWRADRLDHFPEQNDHQCQHCGQSNVRYVVSAIHIPTGKHICFGDICAERLAFANFDAFKASRIRALAAARNKAHKLGLQRELFLSTRPELKAALERIQERKLAGGEGLSGFALDLFEKFGQWATLSDKQIEWAIKLSNEVQVNKVAEARKVQAARSQWIGSVGERLEITAQVKAVVDCGEGQWGHITLTILETSEGAVLTYFNHLGNKDETVTFKATIKGHNERDGVKQTALSRCKVIRPH